MPKQDRSKAWIPQPSSDFRLNSRNSRDMATVSAENEETPDHQLSLRDQGFLLVRPPGT